MFVLAETDKHPVTTAPLRVLQQDEICVEEPTDSVLHKPQPPITDIPEPIAEVPLIDSREETFVDCLTERQLPRLTQSLMLTLPPTWTV